MKKKIIIVSGDPNSINSELIFKMWNKVNNNIKKKIYLISNFNLIKKQFKILNYSIKLDKKLCKNHIYLTITLLKKMLKFVHSNNNMY